MLKLLKASILSISILTLTACGEDGKIIMETTDHGCFYQRSGLTVVADDSGYTTSTCLDVLYKSGINTHHYSSILIDGVEYARNPKS